MIERRLAGKRGDDDIPNQRFIGDVVSEAIDEAAQAKIEGHDDADAKADAAREVAEEGDKRGFTSNN